MCIRSWDPAGHTPVQTLRFLCAEALKVMRIRYLALEALWPKLEPVLLGMLEACLNRL